MFSSALLLLAAAAPAFAAVFVTSPVATTTWQANQQQTISWKDDGAAPALKDFGPSKVSVYVGNQQQQTLVQAIADSVDVSTTSSILFTPEASVGENGAYYFIRFESLNLKDANNPAYPALAFSSKYTMNGMTGTFSADVKAQIAGSSAAGGVPGATSTPSKPLTTSKSTTATTSGASNSASAAGSSADNGAVSVPVSALTCAAGIAVAVFSAMLV